MLTEVLRRSLNVTYDQQNKNTTFLTRRKKKHKYKKSLKKQFKIMLCVFCVAANLQSQMEIMERTAATLLFHVPHQVAEMKLLFPS